MTMTTTAPARSRFVACAQRLGVDLATAHAICDRNVDTCEAVVTHLADTWRANADDPNTCCGHRGVDANGEPEYKFACPHLLSLWAAKGYLTLAKLNAPKVDAYPCGKCDGSGLFYSGGMVLNGTFTGTTGKCYPCEGKGWMTSADRKRTDNYWKYFARF